VNSRRNRWIMLLALGLALLAVAMDYRRHPPGEAGLDSISDDEGAPCVMDGTHHEAADDEYEEL